MEVTKYKVKSKSKSKDKDSDYASDKMSGSKKKIMKNC